MNELEAAARLARHECGVTVDLQDKQRRTQRLLVKQVFRQSFGTLSLEVEVCLIPSSMCVCLHSRRRGRRQGRSRPR